MVCFIYVHCVPLWKQIQEYGTKKEINQDSATGKGSTTGIHRGRKGWNDPQGVYRDENNGTVYGKKTMNYETEINYLELKKQREKALKAAASCTPKKAVYIPATESAWKREIESAPDNTRAAKPKKQERIKALLDEGKTVPEIAKIMQMAEKNVYGNIYLLNKKKNK